MRPLNLEFSMRIGAETLAAANAPVSARNFRREMCGGFMRAFRLERSSAKPASKLQHCILRESAGAFNHRLRFVRVEVFPWLVREGWEPASERTKWRRVPPQFASPQMPGRRPCGRQLTCP